ncbi:MULTISPECIES: hypothetical protein [Actinoalloteichus]|uniref:Uncharacterized protein n=1 Tax=Actinoalloteichus caeruleus DSM 43889 TaxID=1120930 RepID=A0ABT1JPY1_ACTCY|nr:hypothetical protein [Actinoalloteichus caeruleus]MCP2334578.1 hypothetical protein [Actinoalloteichus caeruleus DSM 43889]
MNQENPPPPAPVAGARRHRWRVNEDWAATLLGLVLLVLVLTGAIPEGLVP